MSEILIIEPFYGGSHAQLINVLSSDPIIGPKIKVYTLPAKKWHWKARSSALHFMQVIQPSSNYRVMFSSSVLNLAELVALRPDLASLWKVVYFHENQLVYPVRKHQDRDFHYGYCQITTSLVADAVVFNSQFNKESFLKSISSHLKLIPDHRPKNLEAEIRPKCQVIYFPVDFKKDSCLHYVDSSNQSHEETFHIKEDKLHSDLISMTPSTENSACASKDSRIHKTDSVEVFTSSASLSKDPSTSTGEENIDVSKVVVSRDEHNLQANVCSQSKLHIVWPHRWEHDKNPEMFFQALFELLEEGYDFCVSVLGESYLEVPEIFKVAEKRLSNRVMAWGFQDRDSYRQILNSAHVAVSTADHEFFGVSMLEAASRGCFPLCPKRLVYPEIYPGECLYSTQTQLVKCLKKFCKRPDKIPTPEIHFERFSWKILQKDYYEMLKCSL